MAQARVEGGTPDPFDAPDGGSSRSVADVFSEDEKESVHPSLLGLLDGSVSESVDDDAFAEFYRYFKPKLVSYASRIRADDPEGTADLALYDTHRALTRGTFKTAPALRAYLYRAVKSRVAGDFRRPTPLPVAADDYARHDLAVDDESQVIVDREVLEQLLGTLSEAQQEVIRARYLDGMTAEAVASGTGRSPDAVYQLQRRALEQLRRSLPTVFLLLVALVGGLVVVVLARQANPIEDIPVDQPDLVEDAPEIDDSNGARLEDDIPLEIDGLTVEVEASTTSTLTSTLVTTPTSALGSTLVTTPTPTPTSALGSTSTSLPTSTTRPASTSTTTMPPTTSGLPVDVVGQVAVVKFQHSDLCLTVAGSAVGAAFTQEPCRDGGFEQTFEWVPRGNGYAIRPVHSMLCLGAEGGSLSSGARIVQSTCTGGDEQSLASPDATLTFANTGLCVGVVGESVEPGALLEQSRCGSGLHQRLAGA